MTAPAGLLRLRLLHAALIALLLFAQHGALTHALLHAAHQGEAAVHADHAHEHAHGDESPAGEWSASCGFDLLYSEVLGGAPVGSQGVANVAIRAVPIATGNVAAAGSPAVPYDSRAPPAFS
ncbi:MAG: hypothetical protein KF804_08000 [Burkholderiales bacterium]|jgi:hypothetical protein|nr:hypothetical protein [Burkholderiales bacterium]